MSKEAHHLQAILGERFTLPDTIAGDVRNLLGTGYDADYVARWTRDLELVNLLKECLSNRHVARNRKNGAQPDHGTLRRGTFHHGRGNVR